MRLIRQLQSALVGAAILAAALLGAVAPASAHNATGSTSPASGANWADGAVQIVDNVAWQKLKPGGPAGARTVVWRVVSSDSHPILGKFTFTATAGAGSTAAAAVPTMGTAQPGTTPEPSRPADSSEPFPWSIVIFVGTAIGIVVVLGLMAKRRLTPDDGGPDGTTDS